MSEHTPQKNNYKIQVILYILIAISLVVITYCILDINTLLITQSQNYVNHLHYHIANDNFRQGSDILTNSVRRYIVTMKPEYIDDYFHEVQKARHREKALNMVKTLDIDHALKNALIQSMKESLELMFTEYHAMRLIADEIDGGQKHEEISNYPLSEEELQASFAQRHAMAQELLWNDSYITIKNRIYGCLSQGLDCASMSALSRSVTLRKELIYKIDLFVISLVVMLMSIFGCILYRRAQHEQMLEAQANEIAQINIQLKEERDKSIKAEKAKSYFFSSVSHDIRTPLNAIIGFSEMLQLGIDDPKDKEKALDAIITSGHTLLELINDVLDLSKLEAGKMEIRPAPTDITSLINKVASSFDAATTRVSVRINTEIQKMPCLKLDPQRIRQILFNLIGNAVKFTSRGFVTIRASYDNGTFTLAVSDTGCGISEEGIKKLMSPYVQLHDHDSSTGTGLGLAICKQLSKQMNGTIEITSTLGKGSTFTLRVPNVEACSEQESEAFINDHAQPKAKTALDNSIIDKNILVVDDQKLNQSILRSMLSRLGIHNVSIASNGREALETMVNDGNIDLVLTDMFMPVMDGEELVREIRKSPELAKIPVFAITADVEMLGHFKEKGFDNMLIKPITLEKLQGLLALYKPHEPSDSMNS